MLYFDSVHSKVRRAAGNFFRRLAGFLLLAALPAAAQNVTLAWTASTNPAELGFKIHYGAASRFYTNALTVGNVTNATINGLVAGATYHFAVTTYDAAGNESAFSDEIIFTVPTPTPTPPAPVKAKAVSAGRTVPTTSKVNPPRPSAPETLARRSATIASKNKNTAAGLVRPASANHAVAVSPKAKTAAASAVAKTAALKADSAPATDVGPVNSLPSKNAVVLAAKTKTAAATAAVTADVAAANELAARAGQFYAAAAAFDVNADRRLAAAEQAAWAFALRNEFYFVSNQFRHRAAAEAAEVTAWAAALYAQIAPLDANADGELQPPEQTALAAALLADTVALPVFAALLLEEKSSNPPAPGAKF
jgi:Fibronectin type III domain